MDDLLGSLAWMVPIGIMLAILSMFGLVEFDDGEPADPARQPAAEPRDEIGTDVDGDGRVDGMYVGDEWISFGTTSIPAGNYGPYSDRYVPRVSDRDCSDYSGPVRVGPSDPHGLDRDNDGIGCE